MDRNEILEKCRAENCDEGIKHMEDQGRKIGEGAVYILLAFIIIFNHVKGVNNYLPITLTWAFSASEIYAKYKFKKNIKYLVFTIASALACLTYLVLYIINI